MAIAIVEELWGRIRAHIDDKITAAEDAAASAEADRVVVEQAASSASWDGDRLTVLGATSPSLTGETGPAGATPYVGENGTWWVGDTDTGVRAQGPEGAPGDGAGDVLWSELTPALAGKADSDHSHTPESIGAAEEDHTHSQYATTTTVTSIDNFHRLRPAMHLWSGSGSWSAPAGALSIDSVLNVATGEIHSIAEV